MSEQPDIPVADEPTTSRRKHSRRIREWQKLDKGLVDASLDLTAAVEKGLTTWRLESERSQASKKNGALKDVVRNWGKAYSKALKVAADAPEDLLDAWNPSLKQLRKLYRF